MNGKAILVKINPTLLEEMDALAKYRGSTRSDLIREAVRVFIDEKRKEQIDNELKHAEAQRILNGLKLSPPPAAEAY